MTYCSTFNSKNCSTQVVKNKWFLCIFIGYKKAHWLTTKYNFTKCTSCIFFQRSFRHPVRAWQRRVLSKWNCPPNTSKSPHPRQDCPHFSQIKQWRKEVDAGDVFHRREEQEEEVLDSFYGAYSVQRSLSESSPLHSVSACVRAGVRM